MHALEAADVRWLGFNAKHYIIAVIGGVKVGFLAFCGIYGQCEGTSGLPFAPVKYTSTSARSAVGKLRQVYYFTCNLCAHSCFDYRKKS